MKRVMRAGITANFGAGTALGDRLSSRLIRLFLAAGIGTMLVACGASSGDESTLRDSSAKGILDSQTGEVIMPMSEYDIYDLRSDQVLLNRVADIDADRCMKEKGFKSTTGSIIETPEMSYGDRPYGLWDEARAKKYGFEPPDSGWGEKFDQESAAGGPQWNEASEECRRNPSPEAAAALPKDERIALVDRLRTEARTRAQDDPAWQAARQAAWKCLESNGLEPLRGANDWGSKQSVDVLTRASEQGAEVDRQESIRLASIEAQCNLQTGTAQALANLEASYQQPLIEENQAALNELKAEKQRMLTKARDYIATYG